MGCESCDIGAIEEDNLGLCGLKRVSTFFSFLFNKCKVCACERVCTFVYVCVYESEKCVFFRTHDACQ